MGGGGGGGAGGTEVKKKYKGKLNEKTKSFSPINPEKYSCYGLKKKSYREFDKESKLLRLPSPPA